MLGVGQGQRGVAHQAEVPRVRVRGDGLRIFGCHVDVAQASAATAFVQGRLEERPIHLLVARAVHRSGGGQQRHSPSVGVEQDGFPCRIRLGVVVPEQLAGRRHENRESPAVGPRLDGLQVEDALVGPTALTPVADVVHDQGTFVHTPGNFRSGVHVAFPARGVGLDIRVRVHLQDVVCWVVVLDGEAVRFAVFHVPVAVEVVAVLVVRHEQNPVSPWAKRAAPVGIQARRRVLVALLKAEVCGHLADHSPRRIDVRRWDAPHAELQEVLGTFTLALRRQREVVVRTVARGGDQALLRVVRHHRVASALHVAVFVGRVPHQQQVAGRRDGAVALQRPVAQHHHQHFDGGGVGHPAVEGVEHVLLLHHGHTLAQRRMQRRQGIGRRLQFRNRDDDVIRLAQTVQVAVGRRPKHLWPENRPPTKRAEPLHFVGRRRPGHRVALGRQVHTLHFQGIGHIPHFLHRAERQRQPVLRPKAFPVQRQAVDGHLASLVFQVLWNFVGQIIHPRVAVVGPRVERGKDLQSPFGHRGFHGPAPVPRKRQRRRRQRAVREGHSLSLPIVFELGTCAAACRAHGRRKTNLGRLPHHRGRHRDVVSLHVGAQRAQPVPKPISAGLDQVVIVGLFHPSDAMAGARFSHLTVEALGRLHGCQGQFRRGVQPHIPLRRVPPVRRRVTPSVLGRPVPALVGACMPTHFVSWVKRPIAQPAPNHALLGHVQRAIRVVLNRQIASPLAKQPQPQHVQGVRLDAGFHQLVVADAVHAFLGGRKRQPHALGAHARGRPVPRVTVLGDGGCPKRRFQAHQPFPPEAVPPQRLPLTDNPGMPSRGLGQPTPCFGMSGRIGLMEARFQLSRACRPLHPLVQHFHAGPRGIQPFHHGPFGPRRLGLQGPKYLLLRPLTVQFKHNLRVGIPCRTCRQHRGGDIRQGPPPTFPCGQPCVGQGIRRQKRLQIRE